VGCQLQRLVRRQALTVGTDRLLWLGLVKLSFEIVQFLLESGTRVLNGLVVDGRTEMANYKVEETLSLELTEFSIELLGEQALYLGNKALAVLVRELDPHRAFDEARGHAVLVLPPNG
jgi:hypothetical protein